MSFRGTSIPQAVALFSGIIFPFIAFTIFGIWYVARLAKAGRPDTGQKENDTLACVIPLGILILAAMLSEYLSGWTLKLSVFGSGLALFFIIPPLLYWRRLWRLRKHAAGAPAC